MGWPVAFPLLGDAAARQVRPLPRRRRRRVGAPRRRARRRRRARHLRRRRPSSAVHVRRRRERRVPRALGPLRGHGAFRRRRAGPGPDSGRRLEEVGHPESFLRRAQGQSGVSRKHARNCLEPSPRPNRPRSAGVARVRENAAMFGGAGVQGPVRHRDDARDADAR
ncbi:hypothetical protein M885DRAFT_511944 [Pelagophyceae sp. CCMP2097]|nr:hypothetical protein M885DRAFT_511944 [Pelagophyceae sp. CCMP2097]